jgi:1,4-dihydroxy-2-naphthoyl-CoA hydrolase
MRTALPTTAGRLDSVPGMGSDDSTPSRDWLAEAVRRLGRSALSERMGIRLVEASPERTVGTMPVEGNTQPMGILHGGASCVLAESLGSIAATLHAMEAIDGYALGLEISATHHRSVSSGTVTGVATPIHRGRTVASYEIVITDESGQRVCTARLTCVLRRSPDAPDRASLDRIAPSA